MVSRLLKRGYVMDIYASDNEKGEDIKRWWRENGYLLIAGSILALTVILAGNHWLRYQQTQSNNAANTYHQITNLMTEGKWDGTFNNNELLLKELLPTPYAVLSAFEMAMQAILSDEAEDGKSYLEWIISNAELTAHAEIALLRLAKLCLNKKDYKTALSLIDQSDSDSFASLFLELRGDILAEQGKSIEALAAYQSAILNLIEDEPRRALLNMKIDDVAVASDL